MKTMDLCMKNGCKMDFNRRKLEKFNVAEKKEKDFVPDS